MKTGRDVIIGALLGPRSSASPPPHCRLRLHHDEGLSPRHVSRRIATQNPVLRERFTGTPEFVETFFQYIAEEVREGLAALGLRSLEEAIGRVDLVDSTRAVDHWKASGLDSHRSSSSRSSRRARCATA